MSGRLLRRLGGFSERWAALEGSLKGALVIAYGRALSDGRAGGAFGLS